MKTLPPDFDLVAYLRTQFSTLDEAKAWARRWPRGETEIDPMTMSSRSMAAYVSAALEGEAEPAGSAGLTNYLATRYGREIVEEIWIASP